MLGWFLYALGILSGLIFGAVSLPLIQSKLPEVSTFQAIDLAIRAAAVIATLLAVVVALFKDELRRIKLKVTPRNSSWLQEGNLQTTSNIGDLPGPSTMDYVTEYFSEVTIKNVTGLVAKECEILLSHVSHSNDESLVSLAPCGPIGSSFQISPQMNHVARLIEVSLANESGPQQQQQQQRPPSSILKIGGHEMPPVTTRTTWYITYRICGSNTDVTTLKLKCTWDGTWGIRKNAIALTVESCK